LCILEHIIVTGRLQVCIIVMVITAIFGLPLQIAQHKEMPIIASTVIVIGRFTIITFRMSSR